MSTAPNAPLKLDDLVALNDEIAALVRAGIPLELGLQAISPDLRGSLAIIIERIAVAMSRGASLPEAIGDEGAGLPRVYRAVVEAGLRSGRLPAALECLSTFARALGDMRNRIRVAMIYPAIVLVVAYGLFVTFVACIAPRFLEIYRDFRLPIHGGLSLLEYLQKTIRFWGPAIPLLTVLLLLGRAVISTVAARSTGAAGITWSSISSFGGLAWLPWGGRIVRNFQLATFADLLSLLLEHGVPYPDAVLLAAEAANNSQILRSAARLAGVVRQGGNVSQTLANDGGLPPYLRWTMTAAETQGAIVQSLQQAAEHYRRRAGSQADWFKMIVPLGLVLIVGGGATLLYALTLFVPLSQFLNDLSV